MSGREYSIRLATDDERLHRWSEDVRTHRKCSRRSCGRRVVYIGSYAYRRKSTGQLVRHRMRYCDACGIDFALEHGLEVPK